MSCPHCKKALLVLKTQTRTITTLTIGTFNAHETIRTCVNPLCGHDDLYESGELTQLVPHQGRFGYDVIVFIGMQLFIKCRSEGDVVAALREKGVSISRSEIGVLARKFVVYLSILHQECKVPLRTYMNNHGGYILHLDSTCEAGSPHLMSVLDGISEVVLDNIKLPSENAEQITAFLLKIKENYGDPIAAVHDMAKGILLAISIVFPFIPDFICHFHFLRDIGKDLLSDDNDILRKRLRVHGIQSFLYKQALALKPLVANSSTDIAALQNWLDDPCGNPALETITPAPVAYALIHWVLDGKNDGDGYGFPFDRPYLTFFQRLCEVHEVLDIIRCRFSNTPQGKQLGILWGKIGDTIGDPLLKKAARAMQEKSLVFDQLRQAMRIALPHDRNGLNDEGKQEMNSIRKAVTQFCVTLTKEIETTGIAEYRKMLDQIQKYWEKLFADPIIKNTPSGPVTIYPQRTNNLLERFFRELRRNHRKRSGTNTMTKALKAILTDTPLVANLNNPEYYQLLLDGKSTIEERFAHIEIKIVREKLQQEKKDNAAMLPKVKRIIKRPGFFQTILNKIKFVNIPTAF